MSNSGALYVVNASLRYLSSLLLVEVDRPIVSPAAAKTADGVTTPVSWAGGSAPGHADKYLIVSFAMIDKIPANPAGNEEYVVFGSSAAFS